MLLLLLLLFLVLWCALRLARFFTAIEYVECNSFCQEVLTSRMAEKCIPRGKIFSDITKYQVTGEAKLAQILVAGFPCQARPEMLSWSLNCLLPFAFCIVFPLLGQGVSCAGSQGGLSDERSALCKHIWRIWDSLSPSKFSPQKGMCVWQNSIQTAGCNQTHHFELVGCVQGKPFGLKMWQLCCR